MPISCADLCLCRNARAQFETQLPASAQEMVLKRLEEEGGKLQSFYIPPEDWEETESAKEVQWEQKVQMQARRDGSGIRQNVILRNELGKG